MTQQTKSMVTDMTTGNVTKLLLSFAFPLFVSNALQAIYNIVDMIVVGQNLGAKEYERVPRILRTVGTCTIVISTVFAVGIGMFQESVYALFTSDVSVLAAANILLIPIILNFYGSATRSVAFSLINGSGNTKLNYAVAVLDGIISRIGIAALLGFVMKMECLGFWYGDALAGFIPIVIGMCYFISGRWKKRA